MFDFNYLLSINMGIQGNSIVPTVQSIKICNNVVKGMSYKVTHAEELEPGVWKGVHHYEFD